MDSSPGFYEESPEGWILDLGLRKSLQRDGVFTLSVAAIKNNKCSGACLRAIDVQILQQLLVVNEGMESVRWILEERGNLTSRCSSLTSSQYSLAGSRETSRRGSWNSLQDPNDKLDTISIGSYLDTLADDLDEYSLSISEPLVCSTPYRHGLPLTTGDQGGDKRRDSLPEPGDHVTGQVTAEKAPRPHVLPQSPPSLPTANGSAKRTPEPDARPTEDKAKARQNGRVDKYKVSGKIQLEYDAHWRWVQSQDDVTFL
ncbi:PREDICTED: leucine rich adaptor protein 1-like [Nanorana parkeri]|uniref:leucine rich adaptor protein 1-like n=1 Tax=Nanorana parkeri TaxID=125878 RepID=UPI00085418E8|nr:PREDICTED: leucine rich adaptor protein 1-like [Nanorana parkeri]